MPEDTSAGQPLPRDLGAAATSAAPVSPALAASGLEDAADGLPLDPGTRQKPAAVEGDSEAAASTEGDVKPASEGGKKPRPTTVAQLIEFAYAEEGRRLGLSRKDFAAVTPMQDSLEAEVDLVRRLAAGDRWLAVPPVLLTAVAELSESGLLRQRLVDLAWVALKAHPVFAGQRGGPESRGADNVLLARDINEVVLQLPAVTLAPEGQDDVKPAQRERLRVNAVTAYLLLQALQGALGPEQIAQEMAELIWTKPATRGPRAAAMLITAKSSDALSQVSRQFEAADRERQRQLEAERLSVQAQHRRALVAEQEAERLRRESSAAEDRNQSLAAQVADLTQRLGAEQSNRVVDKSHLMDDYEILRTQVIRRLTKQVGLLSDGLHALRNGSPQVAEEFVDRALTAIAAEVTKLKESDGGTAT